jgi:hypothetical protein
MSSCPEFRFNKSTGQIEEKSASGSRDPFNASRSSPPALSQKTPGHPATTAILQASAIDPEHAASDPEVEARRQALLAAFREKWPARKVA